MKTARARRARATLLAILLPALLVAACGNGGSQASGAMAPADPSPAASDAPTGGPFQPVAIPVEPVLPDSSDPLALDELGPGPGPVAPMAGQVRTGEQATVETPIGSRGGTVTTPGGTRLVFQAGSLSDGTKVIVNDLKAIDLTGAGGAPLPIALKPVSLTEVDLGGVEPTLPVVMTIPVTVGSDEVALAGHFDPATGALEPLTLLASDAASITVAVTRFPAVLTFIVPLGPLRFAALRPLRQRRRDQDPEVLAGRRRRDQAGHDGPGRLQQPLEGRGSCPRRWHRLGIPDRDVRCLPGLARVDQRSAARARQRVERRGPCHARLPGERDPPPRGRSQPARTPALDRLRFRQRHLQALRGRDESRRDSARVQPRGLHGPGSAGVARRAGRALERVRDGHHR